MPFFGEYQKNAVGEGLAPPEKETAIPMPFLDTPQEMAKERRAGYSPQPRLRPRCARQGSGGNIVHTKLVPWVNTTTHGFVGL